MKDAEWNRSRFKELECLRRVLFTAGSLDRANCIVRHILELQKDCNKLTETNWVLMEEEECRENFLKFLEEEARFAWRNRKQLRKLRKEDAAREKKRKESQ